MQNQPRWLDIDDELYPATTITKQIIMTNEADGFYEQTQAHLIYYSQNRQIDLTDVIVNTLSQVYQMEDELEVSIFDNTMKKFILIGCYPYQNVYLVGEEFLGPQMLFLKIRELQNQEQEEEEIQNQQLELKNSDLQEKSQVYRPKKNRSRTIKEVLQKVAQWRQISIGGKVNEHEAAIMVGISKRTLQDYLMLIRLAEKYGFAFENKMNCKLGELRKFVKEKHESKKEPAILSKFKQHQL